MTDFLILHAPGDADRAASLAAHLGGGLVLTLPVARAGAPIQVGAHIVRVVVWSREMAAIAGADMLSSAVGDLAPLVVAFDGAPIYAAFGRHAILIEAGHTSRETAEAIAAAAARALGAGRIARAPRRAEGRDPRIPIAPERVAARRPTGGSRSRALVTGAGIGLSALGLATAVGYAAHVEANGPLRVAGDESARDLASAQIGGLEIDAAFIDARFGEVEVASFTPGETRFASMPRSDEIAMRVDAHLSVRRADVEEQIARLPAQIAATVSGTRVIGVIAAPRPQTIASLEVEVEPIVMVELGPSSALLAEAPIEAIRLEALPAGG